MSHAFDKEFILSRIEIDPQSGCWNWTRRTSNLGYAVINPRSGFHHAHRLAYHLWIGPPGKLEACHRCDNPKCVNPDHLFLGTHRDNMLDAARKGHMGKHPPTPRFGEQHPRSKLKEADVRIIRASTDTGRKLAAAFGVSNSTIYDILARKYWKHVV